MIKITCCRNGSRFRLNRECKGQFVKEFKDLNELALWWYKSRRKIFFPKIRQELSKEQVRTLCLKYDALWSHRASNVVGVREEDYYGVV